MGKAEEADDAISEFGTAEITRRLGGGPEPHPQVLMIGTLEAIAEDEERRAKMWGDAAAKAAQGASFKSEVAREEAIELQAISLMRARACRAGAEALRKT